MTLTNNTILITGGSSGIGLELAKRLAENNTIIICGRSQAKLQQAKQLAPSIDTVSCDLSNDESCKQLAAYIKEKHPTCNMLINNAALVHRANFYTENNIIDQAELEVQTNLMAPIRLSKYLMPVLEKNSNPTIINVTTGLVYVPRATYPIYNATKAALHAFTQVLRHQLRDHSQVKVVEVLFPVVDTPWHDGQAPDIAITPAEAVDEMLRKLPKGKSELRIGKVSLLYWLSRVAPAFAFKKINQIK